MQVVLGLRSMDSATRHTLLLFNRIHSFFSGPVEWDCWTRLCMIISIQYWIWNNRQEMTQQGEVEMEHIAQPKLWKSQGIHKIQRNKSGLVECDTQSRVAVGLGVKLIIQIMRAMLSQAIRYIVQRHKQVVLLHRIQKYLLEQSIGFSVYTRSFQGYPSLIIPLI